MFTRTVTLELGERPSQCWQYIYGDYAGIRLVWLPVRRSISISQCRLALLQSRNSRMQFSDDVIVRSEAQRCEHKRIEVAKM